MDEYQPYNRPGFRLRAAHESLMGRQRPASMPSRGMASVPHRQTASPQMRYNPQQPLAQAIRQEIPPHQAQQQQHPGPQRMEGYRPSVWERRINPNQPKGYALDDENSPISQMYKEASKSLSPLQQRQFQFLAAHNVPPLQLVNTLNEWANAGQRAHMQGQEENRREQEAWDQQQNERANELQRRTQASQPRQGREQGAPSKAEQMHQELMRMVGGGQPQQQQQQAPATPQQDPAERAVDYEQANILQRMRQQQGPRQVGSLEEAQALPSGAQFIGPDGSLRVRH